MGAQDWTGTHHLALPLGPQLAKGISTYALPFRSLSLPKLFFFLLSHLSSSLSFPRTASSKDQDWETNSFALDYASWAKWHMNGKEVVPIPNSSTLSAHLHARGSPLIQKQEWSQRMYPSLVLPASFLVLQNREGIRAFWTFLFLKKELLHPSSGYSSLYISCDSFFQPSWEDKLSHVPKGWNSDSYEWSKLLGIQRL